MKPTNKTHDALINRQLGIGEGEKLSIGALMLKKAKNSK